MNRKQGLGMLVWMAQKKDQIKDAYELYEATKSEDAARAVATKMAEVVAGIAVGYLVERFVGGMVDKSGLDRVFDSIRRNQSLEEYMEEKNDWKRAGDYAGGKASDWIIEQARAYIEKHQTLDPFFNFIDDIFGRRYSDSGTGGDAGGMGAPSGPGRGAASAGAAGSVRRDPLVLDLDGDGIETTSPRQGTVVLFDHDGDGIKTGTGWVKPDDGWLVMDRDGNGSIDSGHELFGVDTRKKNGQLAADGFDALRDLDDNADGTIDAADAAFEKLRIWQDLNQDGESQAEEMRGLADYDIVSIGTTGTPVRGNLGNGNLQTAAGSFTRADGSVGNSGEVNGAAGNLDLLQDTFHRQFTDKVPLTEQAKSLFNLRGSGQVRDLAEAVSLSTELGDWVEQYAQQSTRQGQIDMLDGFIEKWAATSEMKTLKGQAEALAEHGVELTYELYGYQAGTPEYEGLVRKIGIVERFMGFTYGTPLGGARPQPLTANAGKLKVSLTQDQMENIVLAYDRLKGDVYESLLLRTRLGGYFDAIDVEQVDGESKLDFNPMERAFKEAIAAQPREGILDLVEFISAVGEARLGDLHWNAMDFLMDQVNAAPALGALVEELSSWTLRLADGKVRVSDGSARKDLFIGSAEADLFYGNAADDVLLGRGGNDILFGNGGDDVLDGGAGADHLSGGEGADLYRFGRGSGQDVIDNHDNDTQGTHADTIELAQDLKRADISLRRDENDLIVRIRGTQDQLRVARYFDRDGLSAYAIDNIRLADGSLIDAASVRREVMEATPSDDKLYGYAGNDSLTGEAGDDALRGMEGDDVLSGGEGRDTLIGDRGDDTAQGGSQADFLHGGEGADTLLGEDDGDYLDGGTGADLLDGGAGNDTLRGGDGADVYRFGRGSGQDVIDNADNDAQGSHADRIELGEGIAPEHIRLTRSEDDLYLAIEGGEERLRIVRYFAEDGATSYAEVRIVFADDTVWDVNAVKALSIAGTEGADRLYGYASNDDIDAGEGNDTIEGAQGDDTLKGAEGNDTLRGDGGADTLLGEDGDDYLDGGAGDDLLDGGAGNDTLRGSDGADVYRFGRGSGQDVIDNADNDAQGSHTDRIELGEGIAPEHIRLTRSEDDLYLAIEGGEERLRIVRYFAEDGATDHAVERILFTDGTVWDVSAVKAMSIIATAGADQLYGFAGDDQLEGGEGDDTLSGLGGDDELKGGDGGDRLSGGAGNDTLEGDAGHDTLYGDGGRDLLHGGEGNDSLFGGAGDDILDGGGGNDYISDGVGADVFLFGVGSGQDTLYNDPGADTEPDMVQLDDSIEPTQVGLKREDDDLVIVLGSREDRLRVRSYFRTDGRGAGIQLIKFADGTTWDAQIIRGRVLQSTDGNDNLYGYDGDDALSGGEGDDSLYGNSGDDTLAGDAGDDRLRGGEGNDTLAGGAGNDTLEGDAGDDVLNGGADNDTLYGKQGDDILDGGAGNDFLSDGLGADVYAFGRGSGQDTLYNAAGARSDADTHPDRIRMGEGIAPADVILSRQGADVLLRLKGAEDSLRLRGYFSAEGGVGAVVDLIEFHDGTVWDVASVRALVLTGTDANDQLLGYGTGDTLDAGGGDDSVYGYDGDDVLIGGAGADFLLGGEGNDTVLGGAGQDTLRGEAGDDSLDGGTGTDSLAGGAGADVYHFGRGSGQDIIDNFDSDTVGEHADTIQLGANLAPSDLILLRAGNDLWLRLKDTEDSLRVRGYFNEDGASAYAVERLRFADGSVWDAATVLAKARASVAGDDTLIGSAGDDLLEAGPGNDRLYGRGGDDVLRGQQHDDSLLGEAGDDILDGGSGNDYLYGEAGDDLLDGGSGNDHLYGHAGADVYRFGRGAGQDTISNADDDDPRIRPDTIELENIGQGDILVTREGDDLIVALKGSEDKLRAQFYFFKDGNSGYAVDTLRFADGSTWDVGTIKAKVQIQTQGNDKLYGYAGTDTLAGGEGNDTLIGNGGDDTLAGDAGEDALFGGEGNDGMEGGAQADRLNGGAGDDLLDGGADNDSLWGEAGADTYLFGTGSGEDVIYNYDSDALGTQADTLALKEGVSSEDITLRRAGDNLVVGIRGTRDSVYVSQYFSADATSAGALEYVRFADGTVWDIATVKAKVQAATDGDDTLYGYSIADTLSGGAGKDTLYGNGGDDTLAGDTGEDALFGGEGSDRLEGGAQADRLNGGMGDDVLDGGADNDSLWGEAGADTYLFGTGSGEDVIYNNDSDPLGTQADTLALKEGVSSEDVTLIRDGDNLVVGIRGTRDRVYISQYFRADATSGSALEYIRFADGTVWDIATVKAKVQAATDGDDTLYGYSISDTLSGGAGKDTLYGNSGDDTLAGDAGEDALFGGEGSDRLEGGAQADRLNGGAGDDVLDGGADNDSLWGEAGADTYLFGRGAGKDTVYNNDADPLGTRLDRIAVGEGIGAEDVILRRSGESLVLQIQDTQDSMTVQNYFYSDGGSGFAVDTIAFAEGTQWDVAAVKLKVLQPTADNDTLVGYASDDTLDGGEGNDTLYGNAGDDVLKGGAGDDVLDGGRGNDTYVFGKGAGRDVVLNADAAGGDQDRVLLGAEVDATQIWLRRSGSDLELSLFETQDKITLRNWYAGPAFRVDEFQISDGKRLLENQVDLLVSAMAVFAPPAAGQSELPKNYQDTLNAVIAANWQ